MPRMKIQRYSFVLLLTLALSCTFSSATEVVKFGVNESPPCWSVKLPHGGMCGQILQAISREIGLESRIDFYPLSRLIEDDGNNDVGNPPFYMRNQDFAAIVPIAIYYVSYFYYDPGHKKTISLHNVADLRGYRIGVLKGALTDRAFLTREGIKVEESYSHESLFKKLQLGRIDLCVETDMGGRDAIKKLFPKEVGNFVGVLIPKSASPIALMLDKHQPNAIALGKQYREGLRRIIKNGTYQKILDQYYGIAQIPPDLFDELRRFDRLYSFETDN